VPWFRLDDSFHSHPKVIAAGNEAVGLYVRCGTYAAQHLTNGFIPEQVALLYGSRQLAEVLVRTKLWRRTRGGWQMRDYLDYNPSREAVENERKNAAERQRRRRDSIVSRRDSHSDNGVTHTTPTRPDPSNGSAVTDPVRGQPARAPNAPLNGQSTPAARHPSARSVQQAIADATPGEPT
jgi:hypothetical protein